MILQPFSKEFWKIDYLEILFIGKLVVQANAEDLCVCDADH